MQPVAPTRPSMPRRRALQGALATLGALVLPLPSRADGPVAAGARLSADFDPVATLWLGYDPGHETFTADMAAALWTHVPIGMLVRGEDAEKRARVVLSRRGLDPGRVQFVHDPQAPFFMRDPVVFGLDGEDEPFVVDFQWTHYGWRHWCRRVHPDDADEADACARTVVGHLP